jgi:hypothetical protein
LNAIRGQKNAKKGFDRSVDRPVEWRFAFCLQQNLDKGVGVQKSLLDEQHSLSGFQPRLCRQQGTFSRGGKLQLAP